MPAQSLAELVPLLEQKLGLKRGFFESLDGDDENDWSFIIKVHALIEAAISHLLTEHMEQPELAEIFSRLDMSNKATGKAAFVDALGLLEKPERRFISSLSELRNKLVHDVRNVNFNLTEHVESMEKKGQGEFLRNFNLLSTDVTDDVRAIFRYDPRQALWYASMAFLGSVYLKLKTSVHH
jgi:DNA-binding MltR family transcriptional regulator